MMVDSIITLANNKNYLLLMESSILDDSYFLGVLLDDNMEPTVDYVVLKKVEKDGVVCAQQINNLNTLTQLLEEYGSEYAENYN